MEGEASIQVVREDKPKNRKDILLMKYQAVTDAIAGNLLQRKIDAIIDFIIIAAAELPDDDYDADRIFQLEPSFGEIKEEYKKQVPVLCPEALHNHIPNIERWRKQKYLRILQRESVKVEMKLKNHIGWCFEKETKNSQL